MNIDNALQQAIRCHQAGQLQEAERLYRSILLFQPDESDANHNLGVLAMQVGRPSVGLPFLQNAWKIGASKEQYCLSLTNCLLLLNRADDALHIIKNAMQEKGFNSSQARHLLQIANGIVQGERPALAVEEEISGLFNAGRHAALEEKLLPLLNQYPNWVAGWYLLCTAQQILGKNNEGALRRAVQLMPDNAYGQKNRQKVFCVGANETGATAVEQVLRRLGLAVGDQGQAELLLHDWARKDYRRIIRYCQSADAFQDVPFGLQGTFHVMDYAFPGSKFILTVGNNAGEWFESLVRFHTKIVGKGRIPTADDLRQFKYRYPGFLLDVLQLSYGADESTLYNREAYVRYYEEHNKKIIEHFKYRPDDLLVLNAAQPDAMERLLRFLGYPYTGQNMPQLNASKA